MKRRQHSLPRSNVVADTRNKAPKFPDQDDDVTNGVQNTEAERTIAEGSRRGRLP